jgi:hypothetical protein
MATALDYRQLAAEQRRSADRACLAMVRLKHLSAAEKWDSMAEEIERFEPNPAKWLGPDLIY